MRTYLAVLSEGPVDHSIGPGAVRCAEELGLDVIAHGENLFIAVKDIERALLPQSTGAILGDVYYRHGPAGALDETPDALDGLIRSWRSGEISEKFWGSFLLIGRMGDAEPLRAYHSPFSSLPAFYTIINGSTVISSDARLLARVMGRTPAVDLATLALQLSIDDLSLRSTCLQDIRELRCGEALEIAGASASVMGIWDVWRFTQAEMALLDKEDARERLERELLRSGASRLRGIGPSILDLSGGLDSSLLASLCSRNGLEVRAVNMFSPSTEGDERGYARTVASHLGIRLVEQAPDANEVDLMVCGRPDLPRPYIRSFVQETDRLTSKSLPHARAFVNGTGGDAVFCHLQSSAPAADILRDRNADQSYFRTVREVAGTAQCSVWDAMLKSLVKGTRRQPGVRIRAERSFLPDALPHRIPEEELPWSSPPYGVAPGKHEHVRHLYASTFNMHAFSRAASLKAIYPLLSQPLIETCLRIPSWHWIGKGFNRLPAREVASRWLPTTVAWRVSKGGLGQLQRDIYRLNRTHAREILLDGALQRHGLLDRQALEAALGPHGALHSDKFARILRLCDFEAWLNSW